MRMQHHSVGFSVHPVAVCVITYDWMTEAQTMQSQLVTSPCGQKKNGFLMVDVRNIQTNTVQITDNY